MRVTILLNVIVRTSFPVYCIHRLMLLQKNLAFPLQVLRYVDLLSQVK